MKAKGEGGGRALDGWMASPPHGHGHEFEQTPGDGEGQGNLPSMGSQRVEHDLATEQLKQNKNSSAVFIKKKSVELHSLNFCSRVYSTYETSTFK